MTTLLTFVNTLPRIVGGPLRARRRGVSACATVAPSRDASSLARTHGLLSRTGRLPAFVLAASLLGVAAPSLADAVTKPKSATARSNHARIVGVFMGEYVNGVPVYRLPPVNVVATRSVGVAGTLHEQRATSARRTCVKAAAKATPPSG